MRAYQFDIPSRADLENAWTNGNAFEDERRAVANDHRECMAWGDLAIAALIGFAVGVVPGFLFFVVTGLVK